MSYIASSNSDVASRRDQRKPRALADLQLNTILAGEQGTSSEDEVPEAQGMLPEDARAAIGVSLGQEQVRLTSPKTPATEKQAAIDAAGGFFGGGFDSGRETVPEETAEEEESEQASEQDVPRTFPDALREDISSDSQPVPITPEHSTEEAELRLPSPWRAEPKQFRKTKSAARDRFFTRRRGSSGADSTLDGWQKAFMSNLPSMPKNFSLTSPFGASQATDHDTRIESGKAKRSSVQWTSLNSGDEKHPSRRLARQRSESDSKQVDLRRSLSSKAYEEAEAAVGDLPDRPQLQSLLSRPSQLRRSTSDNSLGATRTLSRVSSLGDDSRFDHVQDQVNSRLKAIRDSWQDSNIKLPSISSFNMSNLRPDFMRDRAGSHSRKYSPEPPTDPMTRQPYHSAKAAIADAAADNSTQHPHFNRALQQLEGDVVILGGYRGSILRSAEPPHRQLWVPVKVGLNLRKVDLEVGLAEGADERATEKIIPGGMLSHIGPVDISRRLLKRLRSCDNAHLGKLRVHDYGYDWRLDPGYLSKRLLAFLDTLPCNKAGVAKGQRGATVIAHSLGGLITRHAVNQRPDLFSGVVYAGVPTTCVNILGPMRNGDEVLLSSRVLTAQVNFTIRTSFALLPLEGRCFFDKHTKEEYPVDFFDPQTWIEYRLSPCLARPLPPLTPPARPSGITGYVSSVANVLPTLPLPGRKGSLSRSKSPANSFSATTTANVAAPDTMSSGTGNTDQTMASGNFDTSEKGDSSSDTTNSVRTTVTISREEAIAYLTRTLASVKKFKQELVFAPAHATQNKYPPVSVIYGKTTPTVYGARVNGREGIKHADAYDELAFASGDGVVLARAAMVPEGYITARGGILQGEEVSGMGQ